MTFAKLEYDLNGNILAVNSADGRSASFEYDALGNITAITYPDGTQDTYAYDALGRVISEQLQDGTETEYTYDSLGNVVTVTENGETTTYAYDALSQPVSATYPDGSVEYSEYDSLGNIIKQTDADGNTTTYGYTVESMVSRVTYADGSSLHYAYDKAGNLVRETNADGGITRYTYDLLGQLTNVLSADGTTTEYEYNKNGEVVSELVRSIAYSGEDDTENHYSNLANTSSKPLVATAIRYAYDTKSASSWPPKTTPTPQPKKPTVSTPKTQAKNASQSGRQTSIPTLSEFKELQQSGYFGGFGQYSNNKQSAFFRNPVDYIYSYNKPAYQTYGPVRANEWQSTITKCKEPSVVAETTAKVDSIDPKQNNYCGNTKENLTVAVGLEAAAAFGLRLSAGTQIVADSKGNVGVLIYGGIGGGTPSASISANLTITGAEDIFALDGTGAVGGGSIGGFAIEATEGSGYFGGTFSFSPAGFSTILPEAHGEITFTKVYDITDELKAFGLYEKVYNYCFEQNEEHGIA